MMFKSAVLSALVASVTAKSFVPEGSMSTTSKAGQRLMAKARSLENNEGADPDMWMYQYNIKYTGCSSLVQVREEAGGEDESMLYNQNLVKFSLCKDNGSGSCSSCDTSTNQYVVNMNEFVDAYTEAKMEEQERMCENQREMFYCENANDDEACENQCYIDAGLDYCVQYEGDEEFEIQRYLECAELEGADGNNNNNNQNGNYNYNNGNNNNNGVNMYMQYYVGLICNQDGKSINLAVFQDNGCSQKAKSGTYEAFNYGMSLPFENESLVKSGDCIRCLQIDQDNNNNNNNNGNNNNNNNNNNYETTELCQQSYEMAAKCENNLDINNGYYTYEDTSGCNYINNILPNLEKATRKISAVSSASSGGSNGTSTALAVVFFLSTLILGAYAFFLYRKIHRAKVNLAQSEGMTMA